MAFGYLALQCMYFMLPAGFANMAPVIFKNRLKRLAMPIDRGRTLGGRPIFGSHKTVRGFAFGILLAVLVAMVQAWLYQFPSMQQLSLIDFGEGYGYAVLVGFLMGFGALFGDLMKSFAKRRLNFDPGQPFIPFDQVDFVLGSLLFASFVVDLTWQIMVTSIAISFVFHILINHLAFYTGVRQEKW